ncbi:rubredoxin family protein [Moraxella macacae 0408225]|uniref:Rubredoxin family protein n=1 Tax=Moraxella macacae 0408225 TaxID=1230338 RepID=L2F7Q6_9GAMM|nr:FAD-dependent oxidoreductase [Moraxella macacae]ELA08816.1 rubredoxin family protein [Moraxella macacae 0408225]
MNTDKHDNPTDGRGNWRQFLCRACGWIYDEKTGDPDSGLPAGTRFEDIPDDWVCPLCGVSKRDFEPFEKRQIAIDKPSVNPLTDSNGVLVIGGGTAGWSVIEALRKLDKNLPITLITADSGDRYMKPQLSIAISQNKTADDLIQKSAKDLSESLDIGLVAHTFVIHIDSNKKQVRTTRGDFDYQQLILALGATPNLPTSLPPDSVWRVNHVDMFAKLQQKLHAKPNQHIAIIGAGMIGVEIAEDIAKSGHNVTLINRDNLPLAEVLPPLAAERIKNALIAQNINYLGNTVVEQVNDFSEKGNTKYHICLSNNQLTCDHIIASTGLKLDERLPKRANLSYLPQGIVVDENTLQTSNPDIFAIGDCIAINGQECRFVAPLREQAATIAHQILDLKHDGYQHKTPVIRLKNKSFSLTVTGDIDKQQGWQLVENTDNLLILHQKNGDNIRAKIELKH